MNEIEAEGIEVIRKIAYESNNNFDKKIKLNRKEIFILKFFDLLSSSRTNKARLDFKNLNGDELFNSIIKKTNKNSKEIQEDMIQIIIHEYKRFKNGESLESFKHAYDIQDKEYDYKNIIYTLISNSINSRLLFFTFDKNKLFLQETISFQEIGINKTPIYDFMAISPNVGIMFYFDPVITRSTIPRRDS
jgi:hypothetical protein